MDAIVLAGGRMKAGEPADAAPPGGLKCLQELGGKPMVQWVLDALSAAAGIDRVVVVGLPADAPVSCGRPLTLLPTEGGMVDSILAAGTHLSHERPDAEHALIVSGDVPLVDGPMLAWVRDQVRERDHDFNLCIVERSVMEARFPGSRRTFVRLRDMQVCGGDVAAVRLSIADHEMDVAKRLSRARKHPLQMALLVGPGTLVALMLGRLTLAQAEAAMSRRLGIRMSAIVSPYAELGMDVDKPTQLAMVREELAARS